MGAIFCARFIWSTEKFETPIQRIFPAFLDLGIGFGPVNLIEIDGVAAEAAQRIVQFLLQRRGFQGLIDGAVLVPAHGALGEDIRLVARGLQCATDHFFGVAKAVDCGGVDPVDAEVEGAVNCSDGYVVVLRTPGKFPVAAADGPCAKADGG
jgi:hypothetical protein